MKHGVQPPPVFALKKHHCRPPGRPEPYDVQCSWATTQRSQSPENLEHCLEGPGGNKLTHKASTGSQNPPALFLRLVIISRHSSYCGDHLLICHWGQVPSKLSIFLVSWRSSSCPLTPPSANIDPLVNGKPTDQFLPVQKIHNPLITRTLDHFKVIATWGNINI